MHVADYMYQKNGFSEGFSCNSDMHSQHCENCPQLTKQLQEDKVKYQDMLDNERKKYSQLSEKYDKLKQRSDHVTDYMSKAMSSNEDIEDMNNPLSNSRLAEAFGKIRKNEWLRLFKCMKNKRKDEVKTVDEISALLRGVYEKCKNIADDKVRQLASLHDNADLPDKTEFRDVYRCRRIYGQNERARSKISDECLQRFMNEESVYSESETKSENVNDTESSALDSKLTEATRKFLETCVDCCWLMVISQPSIELRFDVIDMPYTQSMEERFTKYTTQTKVTDTRSVGTIVSLVWPELDDSHGTYIKGSVITVDNCGDGTRV